MLCPNCGTRTTNEHKFCRACGMNLEPVSRALAAHLSPDGAARAASAREAERRTVRRMTKGLVVGVVVIVWGVLLMAFLPGKAFKLLGVASALIGIVAAMVSVLSPLRSMGGGWESAPPSLDGAEAAATGRLLHEQTAEPAPSVADRTTELLHVEAEERTPRA